MCLTIPKKVVTQKGNFFMVENPSGTRQKVKSLIKLKIGDYCLTQQGIIVEKIAKKEAKKIFEILKSVEKI